ncbi:restriction endonuclease [Clostridium paraputrificum]|uniref:restriction endonuclease n=1 Tax=Clostridium paraputrificum TaxID=29363 RepID=UPI0006680C86|nr:restriction endonuclease [Clostridium paraputrificum]MDB2105972.1 restriction endonuclease [Clostridium paraputrificum]MDB2114306.1 restriction endonuclease [Clostridium paraputrificum]
MDFNLIDGYEFEEVVSLLLKKIGFEVEQTSLSGDGGIDIIAYDNRPIFKGKYIIQCKNWTTSVGQPQIRDLYGVVVSEQANKGILITTSSFTKQAISFAENKNLELIDYKGISSLLYEFNITLHPEKCNVEEVKFYDLENFNKQKYLFIKQKINENKNDKRYYVELQEFFHEYVTGNEFTICKSGLLDEYIKINNEIIKRFYKKGKIAGLNAKAIKYINGYLYIFKGDITKSIEIFNDLEFFKSTCDINYSEKEYVVHASGSKEKCVWSDSIWGDSISERIGKSTNVIMKNLYLIFSYLNFKEGMSFIRNFIEDNIKRYLKNNMPSTKISNWDSFTLRDGFTIENVNKEFEEIDNKESRTMYIPIKVFADKDIKSKEYKLFADYNCNSTITIENLIKEYFEEEKVKEELKKVKYLIENHILC